MKEKLL